jgi:hypothetical protein
MRHSLCNFRNTACCAAAFSAIAVVGCGDSCYAGFFNNGNGHVIVAAGSPPPPCSFNGANGAIRVVALRAPVCELCTAAARADHVFVTPRGIQLQPDTASGPDTADWLEIAPQLAKEPRQIDLVGDRAPEILVNSANLPAGGYRELRLQFFPDAPQRGQKLPAGNACGETRWNCIVMADGHAEPLRWAGDVPELLVAIQSPDGSSFMLLPDARMDLRLSLEPRRAAYFSAAEGWKLQTELVGQADFGRSSLEADSTAH